jgi:hypothetical protein
MKNKPTNLKETLDRCADFNFNKQITQEMLWNTAYQLGRSRWYWGPSWMVNLTGWINTKILKIKAK